METHDNILNDNEKYWISVMNDAKIHMENLEKTYESRTPDAEEKRNLKITKSYIGFLEKILKYNNLKDSENNVIVTRLARVRTAPTVKELEAFGYDYIIFNGLYLVMDVMFLDATKCRDFLMRKGSKEELNIPPNVLCHTIKFVNVEGKERAVALVSDDPKSAYVAYNKSWEYPCFDKN